MVADHLDIPEIAFHVGHRKYNIDKRCPWWKRAYFRCIYLPFVRFSFKYVNIPAMDEVEINGKQITFCWYEDGGFFDDRDQAELACHDEFSRVKPIYRNRVYPPETAQAFGHSYPRAGKPNRYAKPTFDLITKNRKREVDQQRQLAESLRRLNQVLDQ